MIRVLMMMTYGDVRSFDGDGLMLVSVWLEDVANCPVDGQL